MFQRSRQVLDVSHFSNPCDPHIVKTIDVTPTSERQYVLRMLVYRPLHGWALPADMEWLRPLLNAATAYQLENIGPYSDRFIYVTIRHGEVTSVSDDVWHVDGFSLRFPHVPEQNYIWASNNPMEVCSLPIDIPKDFDGMKHNIHQLFQDVIPADYVPLVMPEKTLVAVDTYHIHRRPPAIAGMMRTMVRISFVPIQIETDDCQQNPAFPVETFNRSDIRERLTRYPFQGKITSL